MSVCVLVYVAALVRAEVISEQADIIAALTVDVLNGTVKAYDKGMYNLYSVCITDVSIWAHVSCI